MLRRLYVHNYRCLQNFEINQDDSASTLLVGDNGVGKSTVASVLRILQGIGSGEARVSTFFRKDDFTLGRWKEQIALGVEATVREHLFRYSLALDLPEGSRELRVVEEHLCVDERPVYAREGQLVRKQQAEEAKPSEFTLDRHSVALPLIFTMEDGAISLFRKWLADILVLSPFPKEMKGESSGQKATLSPSGSNFADWLTNLITDYPPTYGVMGEFLKEAIRDFTEITNKPVGENARVLAVVFSEATSTFAVRFEDLSDGEKCLFLCAAVLAMLKFKKDILVFWDEPDNFLALKEIQPFIIALRKAFRNEAGGQIWMTSHNMETIRRFGAEEILLMGRENHFQPVAVAPIASAGGDDPDSIAFRLLHDDFDLPGGGA